LSHAWGMDDSLALEGGQWARERQEGERKVGSVLGQEAMPLCSRTTRCKDGPALKPRNVSKGTICRRPRWSVECKFSIKNKLFRNAHTHKSPVGRGEIAKSNEGGTSPNSNTYPELIGAKYPLYREAPSFLAYAYQNVGSLMPSANTGSIRSMMAREYDGT
jgi:hypothetical protein